MTKYLKPKEASELLGVNVRTLARWEKAGIIQAIKTPSGQRRYDVESYTHSFSVKKETVLYCRVYSHAQKPDLNRQVAQLQALYPEARTIKEVGGGLNFKRKKLLALLSQILKGEVSRVVVAHKDRLARFGFDLFNWLCEQNKCELIVLNEKELSPQAEMVEDILAILHCFSSRLYGLRKYKTLLNNDPELCKEPSKPS
ncbi:MULTISPECIES: IS607 family transposase [Moorena]|uniref:IS607 family transposase n=1 Tax=Moorena TaxID=1155738 RepID=UPI0002DED01A|nr:MULTISPECIES: IS607 family transposase [Moorena]NES82303.1 IS607 family transposase [Moorena sp. SIO2B7]NEP68011.1 IS607 family transposase [Moorena sp. SIO3A5]NER88144.1 IS607 family transposase [Moorena sp. SIO3A2]NET65294.1 IS607 family transposase [Moorena sp. SIO1G6]OLT69101.1 DNA invertase [Moorena producens 3L]